MKRKYNGGISSYQLWTTELSQFINLYLNGMSISDIKQQGREENLFRQSTTLQAKRCSGNLAARVKALPQPIIELFPSLDTSNQKLVALLSIMLISRILDEFVYEVYRPKIIVRDTSFHDYEVESFLNVERINNPEVGEWSVNTIQRVKGALKYLAKSAGLFEQDGKNLVTRFPLLDPRLVATMKSTQLDYELAALGGR